MSAGDIPGSGSHNGLMKRWLAIGLTVVAFELLGSSAQARRSNAKFTDCNGCHGNDPGAEVTVDVEPQVVSPGQLVRLTITVTGPGIQVGGFSVFDEDGTGAFSVPAGQAIALDNPQWAFHATAQPASGGSVQYVVDWQAPDTPGAANFLISAVAGNGNGQNSGDSFTEANLQFGFGCTPLTYYFDGDRDGAGDAAFGTKLGCAAPLGYAPLDDDCDGNDDNIHPGATERCNGRDDDCDGEVDEEVMQVPKYPDQDGDGFGSVTGQPVMGCAPRAGYADNADDCDDGDSDRNPGAAELCDFIDNDCDGKVDDGARAVCGVGLCRRESESCFAACVPGLPLVESCDGFDDDCDGETDEADACPGGQVCSEGLECVDAAAAPAPGSNGGSGATPGDGAVGAPLAPSGEPASAAAASSGCQLTTHGRTRHWLLVAGCALALLSRRYQLRAARVSARMCRAQIAVGVLRSAGS